jgi:hypothetical protein
MWGYSREFKLTYSPNALTDGLESLVQEFKIVRNSAGNVSLNFQVRPFRFLSLEKCNDTGRCIPGDFRAGHTPSFSPTILQLFRDPVVRTTLAARLRLDVIATTRQLLDEIARNITVRAFSNHSQRLDAIRCIEEHKQWIDGPESATQSDALVLGEHLRAVRKCLTPIYRRIHENATWWENAQKLFVTIFHAKHRVETWRLSLPDFETELVRQFSDKLYRLELWFNQSMAANEKTPDWEDRPVKPTTLSTKHKDLKFDYNKMKQRFGSGKFSNIKRGTHIEATEKDLEALKNAEWMKNVQNSDLEQLEQEEDSEDDDAL